MLALKEMNKPTNLHTKHAYLNGVTTRLPRALRSEKTFTGLISMAGRYTIKEGGQLPSSHVGQDGNNQARLTPQGKMISAYFRQMICERG